MSVVRSSSPPRKQGGYVRHASSPRTTPDKASANADNVNLERQLDEAGRNAATAMGRAIRAIGIPIGDVWSSPTYRALETVRLAALGTAKTAVELGDGGQSMHSLAEPQFAWLRTKAAERPRVSTNTVLVTHMPNLTGAFPQVTPAVADGEVLVFAPDGRGGAGVAARIPIDEWPTVAAAAR